MEPRDLKELRRDINVEQSESATMSDIRARMTPEQLSAHDGFVSRHNYSVAHLL
jgi:hypothetical protein